MSVVVLIRHFNKIKSENLNITHKEAVDVLLCSVIEIPKPAMLLILIDKNMMSHVFTSDAGRDSSWALTLFTQKQSYSLLLFENSLISTHIVNKYCLYKSK